MFYAMLYDLLTVHTIISPQKTIHYFAALRNLASQLSVTWLRNARKPFITPFRLYWKVLAVDDALKTIFSR